MTKKTAGCGCLPQLVICGSGLFPLRDLTYGAVRALAGCGAVFYQHGDFSRVEQELRELEPRIKLRKVPGSGADRFRAAWAAIKAELARGRNAGYLTYGHPMLFGEGVELAELCRAENIPLAVHPGISSLDALLCAPEIVAQALSRGLVLAHARDLASGRLNPDPHAALVVMGASEQGPREFAGLCRRLLARLGPRRHVFCVRLADIQEAGSLSEFTLDELAALKGRLPHKATLVLPYFHGDKENRRSPKLAVVPRHILASRKKAR